MTYREDPSINRVARIEHARMAEMLIARYRAGGSFFHARTQIMAAEGPQIAARYGKDVAQRAMAMLTSYGPEAMPEDARQEAREHLIRSIEQAARVSMGGERRFTAWQKWCFRALGTFGLLGDGEPKLIGEWTDEELAADRERALHAWLDEARVQRVETERAEDREREDRKKAREYARLVKRLDQLREQDEREEALRHARNFGTGQLHPR